MQRSRPASSTAKYAEANAPREDPADRPCASGALGTMLRTSQSAFVPPVVKDNHLS